MTSTSWSLEDGELSYKDTSIECDYDTSDNFILKVSPNGQYAAVCNIHTYYADFYKVVPSKGEEYPKYMYSLRRNTYRSKGTDYLLEFFTSPEDNSKTVFIFNTNHGTISVCDAETGRELHTDCEEDKFITSYRLIKECGQYYLYLEGWIWNPVFFTTLYKISDLLTTPSYKSITLDVDPYNAKSESCIRLSKEDDMIDILPPDNPFNTRYGILEYMTNHRAIQDFARCVKTTEMIINNKDNLLHKICEMTDENVIFVGMAQATLSAIITQPLQAQLTDLITFKCINNEKSDNNDSKNKGHIAHCFAKSINYNDVSLKYLIPRMLYHGFTRYTQGEISFVLCLNRQGSKIKITVDQKLKKVVGEQHIYEVDNDVPCNIKVE